MGGRLVEAAAGVLVATSTEFMLTTTTVVPAPDGRCLVIDPGVTVTELRSLAAELRDRGLVPCLGFATHPHWDHVLWHEELGDVPRYASRRAAEAARRDHPELVAEMERAARGHDPELTGRLVPLADGTVVIPWHGAPAQLVIHDGHAAGHAAVFLPAAGVLVAGDMCSDTEIPLLDLTAPDPVGEYRAGLAKLAALPGVRWVVPGHGHVGDGAEFRRRLAADRRYLALLGRGRPFGDPRLTQDWLRGEHDAQLRYAGQRAPDRDWPR
jgi:hydroxyacylglutathione hydrolase